MTALLGAPLIAHADIPRPIAQALEAIDQNNPEAKVSALNESYKEQSLEIAKSYQYPTLSLSGVYNNGSAVSSSSMAGDLSSYSGGISGVSAPSSISQSVEGWTANLSSNYYLFTGFLVTDGIERAQRDFLAAKYNATSTKMGQKSQYLQGLMEWQWLNDTLSLIRQADASLAKVQEHKKNVQFMYNEDDDQQFEEKKTYLVYQSSRVTEGLHLVEEFLLKTNPEVSLEQIRNLPKFAIQYSLPTESDLEKLYVQKSLSRKRFELEVKNAEGIKNVVDWQKPYVPNVLLTGGLSRSGTRTTASNETNWSAQLVFTFNFFDGFATPSRAKQAAIGLLMSQQTRDLETDKKVLYLRHQYMKAKVSSAEFNYKKSLIKNKELRLKDIQNKHASGIATQFELNLAGTDLAKAKIEALDVLKNYHGAALAIATELNEWEKINVTLE